MATVRIKLYSEEVKAALAERIQLALEKCGMQAEAYAKVACPVDTGTLKKSISHVVVDNTAYVGTNMEYAIFVEMGTGAKNVAGGTHKPSWVYMDAFGQFHRAYPQAPRPFIKPSIADHLSEYQYMIGQTLNGK